MNFWDTARSALLAAGLVLAATGPARAEEPALLVLSAGAFDALRSDPDGELGVQYRGGNFWWLLRPHAGLLATTGGGAYGYAGVLLDVPLGERLALTAGTALGYYHAGSSRDLGSDLEFRSGVEAAWRFADGARLGLGFYHISNAGLGDDNPGAESVVVSYAVPVGRVFGR